MPKTGKVISDIEEYSIPHYVNFQAGDSIDQYAVQKRLGEGAFGIVYLVKNPSEELFALKLLKIFQIPSERERRIILKRFRREYECGQIDSEYVVQTHDFGKINGNPYIVMDYCNNGNLKNQISKNPNIDLLQKWSIEVLSGLEAMHEEGKYHRDIKPENILLDHNQTAKLTDFGIAGYKTQRLTQVNILGHTNNLFGTYAYIAPEQANNKTSFKSMNAVTDIFSFGVSLYEVLSGNLPFGSLRNDQDLLTYLERAKKGKWDDIRKHRPDLPTKWVNILHKSLHPDYKNERFQSTKEVLKAFGQTAIEQNNHIRRKPNQDNAKYALRIMSGEEPNKKYSLSNLLTTKEGILKIGWLDADNKNPRELGIKETSTKYISRYHATLEKLTGPSEWFIRDGQWREVEGKWAWFPSTNGTMVNSQLIGKSGQQLYPNDIIVLGDTTLRVELE